MGVKGALRVVSMGTVLAMMWGGCGRKKEALVVAQVGDRAITIGELWAFEANVPEAFKTEKSGVEGQRDYLKTMIDREFMLLEAREQGIDQSESLVQKLEWQKKKSVIEAFYEKEIGPKLEISEEEIRHCFEEEGLGRAVKMRHIAVKTEDDVRMVLKEIEQGRSFEEVARERSLDRKSAEKGGLLDAFYAKNELGELIGARAFSMEIGQISEPIRMGYGYEVIQVIAEKPVPFEHWKASLEQRLKRHKFSEEWDALLDRLKAAVHLRFKHDGMELLLARAAASGAAPDLSEQERGIALYEYEEGRITLGDFVDAAQGSAWRFIGADSTKAMQYAERRIIAERLMLDAARRAGFYEDEEILAWLEKKKEDLLIDKLREGEVKDKAAVSEEEIRAEYDMHKRDRYALPEEILITEILVETEEEAQQLSDQIKKGAELSELAGRHTLRKEYRKTQGQFQVRSFEKALYGGDLVEIAGIAPIGQLMGPIEVKGGYSIFRVEERGERRPEPFEAVERRVRANFLDAREVQLFDQLIERLRIKYEDRVIYFEEHLKEAVREAA